MKNKRGEQTRQKIKEKAVLLFAEKGFKEVTMKDICEVTGLSRGGLYCHYESTQQIFQEIIEDLMNRQENSFEEQIRQNLPAVTILDGTLEKYREEMLDSRSSLSVAIHEYFSQKETSDEENSLYVQYLASKRAWEKLLQYGIERREFRQVDISAIIDLLIFSYQGVRMYSRLMPVDKEIPLRILREIRSILVNEA